MKCPTWAKHWRCDEVIECLSIGDNARRDLLSVNPDAYEDHIPEGVPLTETGGREYPPDPGEPKCDMLSTWWTKLQKSTKEAIVLAHYREYDFS